MRSLLLLLLMLALGAIAHRDLLLWKPSSHGLSPLVGWFFQASSTLPQLVFVVAVCLAFRRRRRLRQAMQASGYPLGAALLLLPGLLLFAWGHYVGAVDVVMASVLPNALGSAMLLAGPRLAAALILPVGFLIFAMPAPGILTNQIVYPLQLATARFSTEVFGLLGITAMREGDVLHVADGAFEVIETCSGLRSIEIMTMLAVGYVGFFPMSRVHAALLVVAAPLIGFLLNGARVVALILTPGSDLSEVHSLQGLSVFLGGVVTIYLLDRLLLSLGASRGAAGAREPHLPPDGAGRSASRRPMVVLTVLLAVMAAVSVAMPRWSGEAPEAWKMTLPAEVDGWGAERLAIDRFFVGSVHFSWYASRRYRSDGQEVSVFVGSDDRRRPERSLLSVKNALPGRGWDVEERGEVRLEPGNFRMQTVLARSGGRRVLSYHGYRGVDGFATELLRSALALDRSPRRRAEAARLMRLSTPVASTPEGRSEAEVRLRLFFERLGPAFLSD